MEDGKYKNVYTVSTNSPLAQQIILFHSLAPKADLLQGGGKNPLRCDTPFLWLYAPKAAPYSNSMIFCMNPNYNVRNTHLKYLASQNI